MIEQHPVKPPRSLMPLLSAMAVLSPLSVDLYLASMATMADDLGVNIARIELSLSAYFIGLALGQLVYGPISDAIGRQKPLIFGLTLYMLASLGCALTQSGQWFVYLRLLQALGACANMVTSRAVVRDLYEPREAARIFSSLMLASGLAPIFAPSLGGAMAARLGWRALFYFLALWALLLLVLQMKLLGPQLLQTKRKEPLRFGGLMKNYRTLIADSNYLLHVFGLAAVGSGLFAYMSAASFVFIKLGGLSGSEFSLLFALNGLMMMIMAQINRRLLKEAPLWQVLGMGGFFALLFAWLLLSQCWLLAPPARIAAPLTAFIASLGFIFPNAMAGALTNQRTRAASAAALGGTLQWGIAGFASAMVSRLHDGTARPLGYVVASGATLGALCFGTLFLRGRRNEAPSGF